MPTAPRTHRPAPAARTQPLDRKLADLKRPNANARGYTYRWSLASKAWLAEHPLCVECDRLGLIAAAVLVDHIVPHRGNRALFWDRTNWQSLCTDCHNRKTASGQ